MKAIFAFALLFFVFSAQTGLSQDCPSSIYYKGGKLLKSGTTYYYPSGKLLKSGTTLYYPNGKLLKSGTTIYYSSGKLLKSGTTLYYPNGKLLKSGTTHYYSNGKLLKSGSTYYYKSGKLARSGSTLYRPDGSITHFPINLYEQIDTYGEVNAYLEKDHHEVNVFFKGLLSESQNVSMNAYWDGSTFSHFSFFINTGYENENVAMELADGSTSCKLVAGGGQGQMDFTIYGDAATIDVKVNQGYDPKRVGDILKEALDSIQ